MSDIVLDKAKLRLEALEKEADELRRFIRMYVKLSGSSFEARLATPAIAPGNATFYGGGPEASDFSSRDEIVSAAREVLKTISPRPMQIGDLFDALIDRGIKISGKNPKGNLSAKLAPPDDIVYVKDEGWYYRPNENSGSAEPEETNTGSVSGASGVQNPQPSPSEAQD